LFSFLKNKFDLKLLLNLMMNNLRFNSLKFFINRIIRQELRNICYKMLLRFKRNTCLAFQCLSSKKERKNKIMNTLRNPYLFSCYIQLFIYFYIGRHILKLKYFLHRITYFRICFCVYFKNTIFVIFNTIISVKVFIIIGHKINKYLITLSK
jgi:hypothetical protein